MKVAASSDWRSGIPFETPTVVAEIVPGEATRCSLCSADSALRERTDLWAVKHRHPRHHDGYVRFYCLEHLPAVEPDAPVAPVRPKARARRPAAQRRPADAERARAVCPECFVEVPPTGVCGMCGRTVA